MEEPHPRALCGWFAGAKAENGDWFADMVQRIVHDYYAWRRNYFPEDGVVVDSTRRRESEPFRDAFEDRLLELLARLKSDCPFHSPRYAAHMVSEQTLPSIAGYFAAMLYNPNNVSAEAAPVTVRLELEAARMIAGMLGYGPDSWSHLTGGGTIANIESLWVARTVKYLPLVVRDMRRTIGLPPAPWPDEVQALLRMSPGDALQSLANTFDEARQAAGGPVGIQRLIRAYLDSPFNVVERGLPAIAAAVGSSPVVLIAETHHYSFEKSMDLLGFGRQALVPVRVDSDFRMLPEDLISKLDWAQGQGRHVVAVVAVVGTTEEGAIDPVDRLLHLRSLREAAGLGSFWIHADAAYGGYLRTLTVPYRLGLGTPRSHVKVSDRVRPIALQLPEHSACEALEQLGECDSITIDPHKLGYIPYPAGVICFKSNLVKPIARQDAPYIDEAASDVETERRSQAVGPYILEGSRPGSAAAAVWLSHSVIPLDNTGHGLLIQETVRNACELYALLDGYPEMVPKCRARAVCLCPPGSNIVCYAFRPKQGGTPLAILNALNRRIHERFSLKPGERVYNQSFFVSRTVLTPSRYSADTIAGLLDRLGVTAEEYQREGVFLLRSVLMNPWYEQAKRRGRYFLSELAADLYQAAEAEVAAVSLAIPSVEAAAG